jgi:hypothetical protein
VLLLQALKVGGALLRQLGRQDGLPLALYGERAAPLSEDLQYKLERFEAGHREKAGTAARRSTQRIQPWQIGHSPS